MPLYEYKCDRCGNVFEVIQKFSDTPLEQHENCGGHLEKLLSAAALQFKGTGWYVTDYARKSGNGKPAGKHEGKDSKDSKESRDSKESKDSKDSGAKPPKTESSSSSSSSPAPGSATSEKK
jgi:putative FmdB family regulatory protein